MAEKCSRSKATQRIVEEGIKLMVVGTSETVSACQRQAAHWVWPETGSAWCLWTAEKTVLTLRKSRQSDAAMHRFIILR